MIDLVGLFSRPVRCARGAYVALWLGVFSVSLIASAETISVRIIDNEFVPRDVTINVGDSIHWIWEEGFHTVTSGLGSVDPVSGDLFDQVTAGPDDDLIYQFNDSGVIPYYCIPHEQLDMKGTVTVLGGEERLFEFTLTGDQEVTQATSGAQGLGRVVLSDDHSQILIDVVHSVTNPVAAHVHAGDAGETGGVILDLGDARNPISVTIDNPSPSFVIKLLGGSCYINIYSPAFHSGEIRGQIATTSEAVAVFDLSLSGEHVVPPTDSTATGQGIAEIDVARTAITLSITHDVVAPTAAYLAVGAEGENGGIIINLGNPGSPIDVEIDDLFDGDVRNLFDLMFYVIIQSQDFQAAEIRGQITNQDIVVTGMGCMSSGRTSASSLGGELVIMLGVSFVLFALGRRQRQ